MADWKKKARNLLKNYYLAFEGTQWHRFNIDTDEKLIRLKIAYALFGPPTEDADDIENAYDEKQFKKAQRIVDVMLKKYKDDKISEFRIGIIFIYCKQEKQEFPLPVFSLYTGITSKGEDKRIFIDTQCRTYKNWDDWKNNNCLPSVEYAYPTLGFFTCSGNNGYEFDPEKDPDIEYGSSPQSSFRSSVLLGTDVLATGVSLGLYQLFLSRYTI